MDQLDAITEARKSQTLADDDRLAKRLQQQEWGDGIIDEDIVQTLCKGLEATGDMKEMWQ